MGPVVTRPSVIFLWKQSTFLFHPSLQLLWLSTGFVLQGRPMRSFTDLVFYAIDEFNVAYLSGLQQPPRPSEFFFRLFYRGGVEMPAALS